MPEINSKRNQKKQTRSKKSKTRSTKKTKTVPHGSKVTWGSKQVKTEEKMSRMRFWIIVVGIVVTLLLLLYLFVPDKYTLMERQREAKRQEKLRKHRESLPKSKGFQFDASQLLNATSLTSLLQEVSTNEDDERLILVAFDNSLNNDAGGDPTKVKLFKKFESVAKALPRKKIFKRYDAEELPLIINFDCGSTEDPQSELFCKDTIGGNTPNVIIFRKRAKPRQLPQDQKSDRQIIEYLYNLMQPAVRYLEEVTDTEDFVADDKTLNVILFGDDTSGSYEETADSLRDFARFGRVKNPTTYEVFDVEKTPIIHIWRTFGENPKIYQGNISDSNSMQRFLINNYLPVFGEFNSFTQQRYIKRGLPILWIAYDSNDEEIPYNNILQQAELLANQYLGQLSFVKLDIRQQKGIATNFGFIEQKSQDNTDDDDDNDDDDDTDKEDDDSVEKAPQALIMNQMVNIRYPIDINDIENSIKQVTQEYFEKMNQLRGGNDNLNQDSDVDDLKTDNEDYDDVELGDEFIEDDDDEDIMETHNQNNDIDEDIKPDL